MSTHTLQGKARQGKVWLFSSGAGFGRPHSLNYKTEIKRINDLLIDVYEGICEGDERAAMELQLSQLYKVIKELMDAAFKTKDEGKKIVLVSLAHKAARYKDTLEKRLGVRN